MSVKSLIDNYFPKELSNYVTQDADFFAQSNASKKLIFVAWLWSGKSQYSFRALCKALAHEHDFSLLVLDREEDLYLKLFPEIDTQFESGGMIIRLYAKEPHRVLKLNPTEVDIQEILRNEQS